MVISEGEDMLNNKQIQVTNKGKCVAVLTGFHTFDTANHGYLRHCDLTGWLAKKLEL